ncbi:MAG: hypothetical protein IMY75_08650, partial [Chloroflexi bacterium]|nr:hypothetical protein [Chloroflexota bacterium]
MSNEQRDEKPGFSEKTRFLEQLTGLTVYPRSVVDLDGTSYLLGRSGEDKYLVVLGDTIGFEGRRVGPDLESPLQCPLTPANAAALRTRLDWLRPVPLGLQT